ncbi:hypothetical protein AVEN_128424-1 [Araneus ventricosus]|uniref:BZIP domain-containing protein n=1 Tax=Araneus ventricosus TaxID=182803 RepID=A0A4Y2GL96_ARAVE|nr:hypothetical protein AVEN_128424-1 [Araneus ventricosus]
MSSESHGMQLSEASKFNKRISHDNLEHFYTSKEICEGEIKLNRGLKVYSQELPVDFSVEKDEKFDKVALNNIITSQRSQESSANNFAGDPFKFESPYAAHLSAEGKKWPHAQSTMSGISHAPNGHSENGSDCSTEKNDQFQIQDILCRGDQAASTEEHSSTAHQLNNLPTQPKTNPQPTFNHFGKEENLPPWSTSPSYSMHLPLYLFSVGGNDTFQKSKGMILPYIQTVFPPNHIANHNFPGEVSEYSGHFSNTQGAMLQPPITPFTYPYQQAQPFGQYQLSPFKNIDPSLFRYLPSQSAAALDLRPSTSFVHCNSDTRNYTGCSEWVTTNSSSKTLNPDSPYTVNGSSVECNEILMQDINGESGRRTYRRVPPEERDEIYRERRRRRNLWMKKYRAEKKNDYVCALSRKEIIEINARINSEKKMLEESLRDKEKRLDMVIGNLLSFREKCEGLTKELFEESFKLFLPNKEDK